jgi:hypothetical protein
MNRRLGSIIEAGALVLAVAGPVAATAPERFVEQFTTDPYVLAECDGYDLIGQDVVDNEIHAYFDKDGNWLRDVFHAATTGTVWRSDTGEQIATYSDAGGTFTATSENTFTWTGIHGSWTLSDGTQIKFVGRVVVAETENGFERIFTAGQQPDVDPCSW